ncbi:hypothetical protein [Deinococcus sedimenti]|uniref:Transposase n=1 Tax=Deinococcus sedimenti TaxID=1867090 RepID=A0ABQ2S3D0_9DEIO|nr:hypothetical protein [Deinococcus sedimenti]GGR84407.1 hypothetical protein GCM10008960_09310 [Deinococcus sedimenti]
MSDRATEPLSQEDLGRLAVLTEVYAIHREVIETARAARPKRRKKYDPESEIGQLLAQL